MNELKAATPSARPKLAEESAVPYDDDVTMADANAFAASSVSTLVDLTGKHSMTC